MMYAFSENFVLAYSHDEVVHGKESMINKMYGDYDQKFASLRVLYGYQFSHPGKKLTFMGNEFGQFIEWNPRQPLDWFLLEYPRHLELQNFMRELNRIYCHYPSLFEQDSSWKGFQWLTVDDAQRNTIAFLRSGNNDSSRMVCVFNFSPVPYENYIFGLPQNGSLTEVLNSDAACFGGQGIHHKKSIRAKKNPVGSLPYSAAITLSGLSAVFFEFNA